MGFTDQLRRYTTNLNQQDPIFGGLIPRRELIEAQPQQQMIQQRPIIQPQQQPIMPKGALSGLSQQNNQPGRVVFDWSRQENDRANKALEYENENRKRSLSISEQALGQKTTDDKSKQEIDHRKQALDEWKAKNPEGQIVTVNGKIHVVDKITGQSVDTGLAGDHIDEKEKIRLGIEGQKDVENVRARNAWSLSGANAEQAKTLEDLRQQNRKELADADRTHKTQLENNKPGTAINPTQQRVAEDDAARELLRDPKFAWLERDKHITVDKDGIKVNRKDASNTTYLDEFDKALKIKTKERMNTTRDKASLGIPPDASSIGAPKIGDIKTYPNGNKAKFDGTGWEMIPKE